MVYLVTGEWVEDPTTSPEEFGTLWEKIVRPSLEALSKMADEKKTGGVFAGSNNSSRLSIIMNNIHNY
jgi:hypothetical protein